MKNLFSSLNRISPLPPVINLYKKLYRNITPVSRKTINLHIETLSIQRLYYEKKNTHTPTVVLKDEIKMRESKQNLLY